MQDNAEYCDGQEFRQVFTTTFNHVWQCIKCVGQLLQPVSSESQPLVIPHYHPKPIPMRIELVKIPDALVIPTVLSYNSPMEKHEDDESVTLTKREWITLGKAYADLYDLIGSFPTSMGDFFSRREYLNIVRWSEQLQGRTFDPRDV